MIDVLLDLEERIARIEFWQQRMIRWGVVSEVDPDAETVRVRLPSSLVIGPMPWAATGTEIFVPPASGEQCMVLSPPGDGGRQVALCGIGNRGAGRGEVLALGGGSAGKKVALADLVKQELQLVAQALTAVSSGGGAFTGPNPYTVPGDVAAIKTEAE